MKKNGMKKNGQNASNRSPQGRDPVDTRPPLREALVSVVLPVYNEAEVLDELTSRVTAALEETGARYELIFVDDGSRDQSPAILDRLAADDPAIGVVHFSRNFGHQAAVQAGLAHARGDAVVLMDADLQDAPSAIGRFLDEWQRGSDVVYAIRRHRKENLLKRAAFAGFHRLMSRLASVRVPVDAGNFGLIDRRVCDLLLQLPERDRYFPGLRGWVGFRQTGVEVERGARYDHRPRVSIFGLMRLAKTALFSFSTFPLMLFHGIALMAGVVFLALAGYALFARLATDWAVPGWTTHVLVGSFFGALNALGIGVLGEYVLRIHDQVRYRPLYVVDRRVNLTEDPMFDDEMLDNLLDDLYDDELTAKDALVEQLVGEASEGREWMPRDPRLAELLARCDDDAAADADSPYVELMREAMDLLERGGFQDEPLPPREGEPADTPTDADSSSAGDGEEEAVQSIPFPR